MCTWSPFAEWCLYLLNAPLPPDSDMGEVLLGPMGAAGAAAEGGGGAAAAEGGELPRLREEDEEDAAAEDVGGSVLAAAALHEDAAVLFLQIISPLLLFLPCFLLFPKPPDHLSAEVGVRIRVAAFDAGRGGVEAADGGGGRGGRARSRALVCWSRGRCCRRCCSCCSCTVHALHGPHPVVELRVQPALLLLQPLLGCGGISGGCGGLGRCGVGAAVVRRGRCGRRGRGWWQLMRPVQLVAVVPVPMESRCMLGVVGEGRGGGGLRRRRRGTVVMWVLLLVGSCCGCGCGCRRGRRVVRGRLE